MRSSRPATALALLIGALVASACTSAVDGRGQVISIPASTAPITSTSPPASTAPPTSSVPTPVPSGIARAAATTAIGDPVTADLCTAIGLDPLRNLRPQLTPTFDHVQYPPGCSINESDGTKPVVGVSVFASRGDPRAADGRATREQSGQTVYTYPFDSTTGACEREIKATGVLLTVDAYPLGSTAPDEGLSCDATDAMVGRLAKVVSSGAVPRLPLVSPSLSVLDACEVLKAADVTSLSAFADGQVISRGFGANCEVKQGEVFLFINFVISDAAAPPGATAKNVEGHRLYEKTVTDDLCSYVSTQGTTADGRHEQLLASATVRSAGTAPEGMCDQTAQALASYLTAAGLT